MIFDCIDIVESESKHYITFTKRYGSDVQLLKKALSTITTGKLGRFILHCMGTIRAKKNWNSHGATVESVICELSSIISSLREASTTELPLNFIELIPHGVVHTSHKYGNSDAVFTEYIVSSCESQIIVGREEIYLNPERFNEKNMVRK